MSDPTRGPVVEPARTAETRKTVTVVFSDVSGSTELGERLDPEVVRQVMSRYFEESRAALERHGGTVEKFIGDAIMAVFGIPVLHEDDAVRAVRAAAEVRDRLAVLNEELGERFGVELAIRTGVNTGEVVAGDPARGQAFATGDAVNVAARLQQAAEPGEILLGDSTRSLAGDTVRVERLEALAVRGKNARVGAWRLVDVLPDVPAFVRKLDAPFVGRRRELRHLTDAFDRVAAANACELVTVLGPPGIGKSRLVRELVASVEGRARVVVGRCLPYGEGITYWPLIEIVRQVAGTKPREVAQELVAADEEGTLIGERIAAVVGEGASTGLTEETHWAVRRFFEALARERPLVAVFDDIHWAEPTFLDLIEYLSGFIASAPVLVLATARTDLLDVRPSWMVPSASASSIVLEPLSESDSDELVDALVTHTSLTEGTRARIRDVAEGNALFIEQMLAMAGEDGAQIGDLAVPPTIQALLAARLDRLEPRERIVLERAGVEGRTFHVGALAELVAEDVRPQLVPTLMALARKELIRPDRALFPADDGFRFAHVLIRDVAYESLAKATRAELHERFAAWLERKTAAEATEYDEIVGYHLEQAVRYRQQLGPLDEPTRALADRAGRTLAAAGRRADARSDVPAAINLLGRAAALLQADDERSAALSALGAALSEYGDMERARTVLREAFDTAAAIGEDRLRARAAIELAYLDVLTGVAGAVDRAREEAERAVEVFEAAEDRAGMARALRLLAVTWVNACQYGRAREAAERALAAADQCGDDAEKSAVLFWLGAALIFGPTPAREAMRICDELADAYPDRLTVLRLRGASATLSAMVGRFEEARAGVAELRAAYEELGLSVMYGGTAIAAGLVELLAGDPVAAERAFRQGVDRLSEIGERGYLATTAALLARAVRLQGRDEEAEQLTRVTEEAADASDITSQAEWRAVRARVLASRGDLDEAETLAREAVALAAPTDDLHLRGTMFLDLAEVLRAAGRTDEATAAAREALSLYEAKEARGPAAHAQRLLAELAA